MSGIQVVNKKNWNGGGYYIGRPSALGNPFKIGADGNRNETIDKYRAWLTEALKNDVSVKREFDALVAAYAAFGELILVCWCAPLPCHGEVIREFIEKAVLK